MNPPLPHREKHWDPNDPMNDKVTGYVYTGHKDLLDDVINSGARPSLPVVLAIEQVLGDGNTFLTAMWGHGTWRRLVVSRHNDSLLAIGLTRKQERVLLAVGGTFRSVTEIQFDLA